MVGQGDRVAKEGAVAHVAIFQGGAVCVLLTIAGHRIARAFAVSAGITDGARVGIIAGCRVVGELATAQAITFIVGAGIVVITGNRAADTDAVLTVVADGAGILVEALALSQRGVGAAIGAVARVLRAGVVVITGQLIDVAVAVVVCAVTKLRGRVGGVTIGQAILRADPFSGASAKLVVTGAGRPEGQGHRFLGAGADAGVGDTLLGGDAIYCVGVVTGKAPWAILVIGAGSAAETALVSVVQADVLSPRNALAIVPGTTGATEVGVIGDAQIEQVGLGRPQRLARPTGRTFFAAGLGAYTRSHVVHAPAGKTLLVAGARVQKTPVTGLALRRQLLRNQIEVRLPEILWRTEVLFQSHHFLGQGVVTTIQEFPVGRCHVNGDGLTGATARRYQNGQQC